MALKHILGEVPVIKILGFLLDHRGYDYTKAEITEYAGIGQADMKRDFPLLVKFGVVTETRKIGGVQLYRLDMANAITSSMTVFDETLTAYCGYEEEHDEDEVDLPLIELAVSA